MQIFPLSKDLKDHVEVDHVQLSCATKTFDSNVQALQQTKNM